MVNAGAWCASATRRGCALLAAAVMATLGVAAATADPTVIDFEDLPAGTTVTAQYAAKGAVFDRGFLSSAKFFSNNTVAHSGTRVMRSDNPINEFHSPPLLITFTSVQRRVKMFAGSEVVPISATLKAFDAAGTLVASDGPRNTVADQFSVAFEVSVPTANIVRVELQYESTAFEAIDDLEFEGDPPPPPPDVAPVVQITAPPANGDVDIETLDIAGTVTGEGLISPVNLTIEFRRPPESTAQPFKSQLVLTGTGTTRSFALQGFTGVPMGPIKISVEAENLGGLKGNASITFNNFPAPIRNRLQAELLAGNPPFGTFSFGVVASGCKIAIFSNGAISADSAGVTRVFRGDILGKWLTLRNANDSAGFGCPLSEEAAGPGGCRLQDFTDGRIYSNLQGGATFFVPNVFVDVIDTREVETVGGPKRSVPLSDPISAADQVNQTWLFQRFIRPDRPDLLPSTLEIRGTPPRIWIERQSGLLSSKTAAIWEDFPCDGNLGPCHVDPPQITFDPIPNAGDRFCGGEALTDHKLGTALAPRREWAPLKEDDYIGTPIFGIVVESALAGEDFFGSHEWSYNCPGQTVRPDCPSDWTLHVDPIGPHRDVAPHPSLFAEGNNGSPGDLGDPVNTQTVELEYERFYAEFVGWMGFPEKGDLIYAVGRWIIDCGHDTFKSELHPIYMYSKMKTVTSITNPFTGITDNNPFGGQPATRADVWVNGWYPGGQSIEFDIYPPPRPSPTARLVVNKPVDADAVHGISIQYNTAPQPASSHVHIKFDAPFRANAINVFGQVMWEVDRGYEGQWYLFWRE